MAIEQGRQNEASVKNSPSSKNKGAPRPPFVPVPELGL
jgi:hypothetical protein